MYHFISCQTEKTDREREDEFVEKYAPTDLDSHGFTLAVDSKVPEVHQLFNDLEENFYFYGDKDEFEKKAARIKELDPDYPSGVLMGGFYITDPDEYKAMVTKAYNLSKKSRLKSDSVFCLDNLSTSVRSLCSACLASNNAFSSDDILSSDSLA